MKENLLDLLRENRDRGKPVKIKIGLRIDKPIKRVLSTPDFAEGTFPLVQS